ncbi:MAG TPA: hypothetical protein VHN16_02865 [Streptosporangiaceae bacterium]|nr:hypothetical protein [Streptosporangiaceae bacterium]
MKPGLRSLTALLVILGIGDLASSIPQMIAAHHSTNTPPTPVIVLGLILGVATLAGALGVAQGRRWGFLLAVTCRILEAASNVLGMLFGPATLIKAGSGIVFVLSAAAIVLLLRLSPRRAPQRAASRA